MCSSDLPGCGMTRAMCALAHGRVAEAVRLNALSLAAALALALIPLVAAVELIRGRAFAFYRFFFTRAGLWTLVAIFLAWWVVHLTILISTGRLIPEYWHTSWTYRWLQ